jgi:hypothetical protein
VSVRRVRGPTVAENRPERSVYARGTKHIDLHSCLPGLISLFWVLGIQHALKSARPSNDNQFMPDVSSWS